MTSKRVKQAEFITSGEILEGDAPLKQRRDPNLTRDDKEDTLACLHYV